MLKNEYPDFLGTDDAKLVGEHTFDTSEYLLARHREAPLDTEFAGTTYDTILWQAACHYRAQQIGPKSKQLMELTGAQGHDGRAVLRDRRHVGAAGRERRDGDAGREAAHGHACASPTTELVAGDCHLANTAIKEATDKTPSHPMQVVARAYGIEEQ